MPPASGGLLPRRPASQSGASPEPDIPVDVAESRLIHDRTNCGAAKASCGISSSGSARDNQHLSYPWIVSPRSSMATNSAILRALVSAFLTLPIRYRIA